MHDQLDYMDAIEDALTDEVWRRVAAFARRREKLMRRAGLAYEVEEGVMDAVSDTVLGERRWRPEACSLDVHLCGVIRSRTSAAIERSLRVRDVPVAARATGEPRAVVEERLAMAAGRPEGLEGTVLVDQARQTLAALRAAAGEANDRQVLVLLDAWAEGETEREAVCEVLGLSVKVYKNARQRLMRMVQRLPEELRGGLADD